MNKPLIIKDVLPQSVRELLPSMGINIAAQKNATHVKYVKYLVSNLRRQVTFVYYNTLTKNRDTFIVPWDTLHLCTPNFPQENSKEKVTTLLEALPMICKEYANDLGVEYVGFKQAPITKSVWVFAYEEGYEDPEDGNLQIQLTYSEVNEYAKKKGFVLSGSLT